MLPLTVTQSELEMRRVILQMAATERERNEGELDNLAADLAGLRQDLDTARRAAAMVSLSPWKPPLLQKILNFCCRLMWRCVSMEILLSDTIMLD